MNLNPGEELTVRVPCKAHVAVLRAGCWWWQETPLQDGGSIWVTEDLTPGRRLMFVTFEEQGDVIVEDHLSGQLLEVAIGNLERWEGGPL